MFNSTFFKFLLAFLVIIGTSFLIMDIVGGFAPDNNKDKSIQTVTLD